MQGSFRAEIDKVDIRLCEDLDGKASQILVRRAPLVVAVLAWFLFLTS